ncbi:MAG: fatty acid desaturase [Leptolyngbyaceae cyanobacterium bins.59]|nr:fatty acid desaturase [Leptolyngbyaceae cyanobacterium bins.59]
MALNSVPVQPMKPTPIVGNRETFYGVAMALLIIGVWAISLTIFLSLDLVNASGWWRVPIVLWQMFLYTGLFVTAHDAMHGVIAPSHPQLNNWMGTIALACYALLPYRKLSRKHWQHHHHPASDQDPDFHNGKQANFFSWYFHFMLGYWNWPGLLTLMAIHMALKTWAHIPDLNMLVAWIIPSILSSVQLFYFGTFLPHTEPVGGYTNPHRATTARRSPFWSFLACYHFGYHEEHHEHPHLPWWRLPEAYAARIQATGA